MLLLRPHRRYGLCEKLTGTASPKKILKCNAHITLGRNSNTKNSYTRADLGTPSNSFATRIIIIITRSRKEESLPNHQALFVTHSDGSIMAIIIQNIKLK